MRALIPSSTPLFTISPTLVNWAPGNPTEGDSGRVTMAFSVVWS